MFNSEIVGRRLDLNTQYNRDSGNRYLFFNRESSEDFERFYENRRRLGRMIFRRLRDRGYDLTSRDTLELFANIYDSVGMDFDTRVVDGDTRLLRRDHSNNVISRYNDYHVFMFGNRIFIIGEEQRCSVKIGHYTVSHNISLNGIDNYVLMNPRNSRERRIMNRLINSNNNAVVGYYGNINDENRERHLEQMESLQEETGAELITDLDINNGYAYVLTNRY